MGKLNLKALPPPPPFPPGWRPAPRRPGAARRVWKAAASVPGRFLLWLKNTSICKCLFALTVLAVLAYIAALLLAMSLTEGQMSEIYQYLADGYYTSQLPEELYQRLRTLEGFRVFCTYFLALVAIFLETIVFYNLKLKVPLRLLKDAAARMAENNLDFTLYYGFQDEMGDLCRTFERTRAQLEQNHRELWRAIEERKRLNAAFAHDLRTPLTVLRGYVDFLGRYVPQGKITEEKLLSTLSTMSHHITRLEQYVATMNEAQRLDDISAKPRQVSGLALADMLHEGLSLLGETEGIAVSVRSDLRDEPLRVDAALFMRVAENLVSNALGYAKNQVMLTLGADGRFLLLTVEDDGRGFTPEELVQATKAFYKDKNHENSAHFGLGLNICQTLCERHGGWISLENRPQGGARVLARFSTRAVPGPPAGQQPGREGWPQKEKFP